MAGTLYLVATPIGNLSEMSPRAIETLQHADLIACEDTRSSGVLLKHFGIDTPKTSYHQHNEHQKTESLIGEIIGGKNIALISDAGMPSVSDPGFLLVRAAHHAGIAVSVTSGPVAAMNALAASGLPSDRFVFEGFLPQKKGRNARIQALKEETRTMVFYESPFRIIKLIRELEDVFGPDRLAAFARELTKKFEEIKRGTLSELAVDLESRPAIKGEFVLVTAGSGYSE